MKNLCQEVFSGGARPAWKLEVATSTFIYGTRWGELSGKSELKFSANVRFLRDGVSMPAAVTRT